MLAIVIAGLVALPALTQQSSDVASTVSEDVVERVVDDARARRVDVGRRELAEANARLSARGLPIVPEPRDVPFEQLGDVLLIQAARGNVLADLPEPIVEDLREQLGDTPTLPSALSTERGTELGDRVVSVLPIVPGQSSGDPPSRSRGAAPRGPEPGGGSGSGSAGGSGSGSGGSTAQRPPSQPAPSTGGGPPAAPPRRPGLLEPCVLGVLLCPR